MIESPTLQPPVARKEQKRTTIHGVTLVDDYAWMRDKENPDVTAYLEAENTYAEGVMAAYADLRDELYREMLSHIKQTDVSVPYREGLYWYYSRTEEGLQYGIHCRKRGTFSGPKEDAEEEVILDGNKLAEGHAFFSVGAIDITDDGRWMAYTVDYTGFRQYSLYIKDLETGELLPGTVERVGSVVWAADNFTMFYTVEDQEQKRQYQFYRHMRGTPYAADVLVYQDDDERFNVGAGRTRDGKYIVMESASHTASEAWVVAAAEPESELQLICPRRDEHEYYLDHRNGNWYIRTNDQGRNFRLVTAPVEDPSAENWTERIPHRADVMLEDVDLFSAFYIACEREDGLPRLRVWRFVGNTAVAEPMGEIAFPEPAYSAHPHINRIFDSTAFRYAYQSLVSPSSVYEYDLRTEKSTLLKELEIPGGFDRSLYASERVHAQAEDGTAIPVSIVYRRDKFHPPNQDLSSGTPARAAGTNPLYVYGYGSYGYSLPMGFNSNRLSLLDRGIVMAYAHIRGGGDLGKPWHDAGKMLVKRNTFTDFVAAVEHLTTNGYGDPARVAAEGGSAGGLLMGAIVNMRPDLFRVILSHVPFVDVMNTMLDASLPLTVPEYEEWGDPNQEQYFKYMLSYSPYDNLKPGSYPAMLIKTSLHDSQVMYWEPAKYVAKLRTLKTDEHPLLLVTNMKAGHGGASGRYDYLKEIAFDYAFLLKELGIV
ncbi:MAG TPA: S9 family peptidase [Terracidiphilus sp.]